jgi:hypothetical protein
MGAVSVCQRVCGHYVALLCHQLCPVAGYQGRVSQVAIVKEERIGNQRLILGDCLQVMPLLGQFDAVVTDPPYGIRRDGQKQTTGGNGGRKAYEFKGWDTARPEKAIFDLMLHQSEWQVIWGGQLFCRLAAAIGGVAGVG